MTAASSLISELRSCVADASERIARDFAASGNGRTAVAQRTLLIEDILRRLWREFVSSDELGPRGFAFVATGGFGRGWLFPYSDIDLLFLFADRGSEESHKEEVQRLSQELWDIKLKLSPASRTLAECDRYDPKQYRVHYFSSRLPFSGRRSGVVCSPSRQGDSEAGGTGIESTAARTGRSNPGAAWKVRADRIPSRAESEGDPGRPSRLQCSELAWR